MRTLLPFGMLAACGWATVFAAPGPKDERGGVTVDGLLNGKAIELDPKAIESGVRAALRVLAGSSMTDSLNPGQPVDKAFWDQQVGTGIEIKRARLRVKFAKPREVDGKLNGQKTKFTVTEFVLFEPGDKGPVAILARDGDKYYFSNVIGEYDDLVKWLGQVRGR